MIWDRIRNPSNRVTDEQLSAFADGQLPPHQARRIASEIRAHPRFADRIYAYWRREAALWRALDPVFQEPAPKIKKNKIKPWSAAAGLITVGLLLAGVVLHFSSSQPTPERFADLVLQAYFQPVNASSKVSSPRLFNGLNLRPLSQNQLQLAGREITEYRYRDARSNRIALYEMNRSTAVEEGWFHVMSGKKVPLVCWQQGGKSYLLVGDQKLPDLTGTAMAMQQKIGASETITEGAQLPQGGQQSTSTGT